MSRRGRWRASGTRKFPEGLPWACRDCRLRKAVLSYPPLFQRRPRDGRAGFPIQGAIAFAIVSGFLILRCLWRVFTPGTEYSLPPWPLVSVIFDIVLMIALFVLKPMVPAAAAGSPAYVRHATTLFVGGIAATAIMVLIRLSSDRGWWTGHLM